MAPLPEVIMSLLAIGNLWFGAALAISTVAGCIREKQFCSVGLLVLLLAWTAIMASSLLYLLGIVRQEWVWPIWFLIYGILLIVEGTGLFTVGVTGGMRKWLAVMGGLAITMWGALNAFMVFRP